MLVTREFLLRAEKIELRIFTAALKLLFLAIKNVRLKIFLLKIANTFALRKLHFIFFGSAALTGPLVVFLIVPLALNKVTDPPATFVVNLVLLCNSVVAENSKFQADII